VASLHRNVVKASVPNFTLRGSGYGTPETAKSIQIIWACNDPVGRIPHEILTKFAAFIGDSMLRSCS